MYNVYIYYIVIMQYESSSPHQFELIMQYESVTGTRGRAGTPIDGCLRTLHC